MYEQYFGDEVALFGKDNLQSDPNAVTLGVDYTPVPLLTLKLSHKAGSDGNSEGKADLQLNYQLGTPLDKQLDPDNVALARSLKGARYDMVDRNYDIVLEYKEKEGVLELDLAAVPGELLEGDTYIMQPVVRSKYQISAVNWNGDVTPLSLTATAGAGNPQGWRITLPAWDPSPQATNRYQLSITLTNEKGRQVTSNAVEVAVGQKREGQLTLEGGGVKPASGQDIDAVRLATTLVNHLGEKVNDPTLTPKWVVRDASGAVVTVVTGGACPTDEQGQLQTCIREKASVTQEREGITYYVKELVSTAVGEFTVTADLGSYGVTAPQTVTFTASSVTPEVTRAQILDPQGSDILTSGAAPQVGTAYTVKLFNAAGEDVTASFPPEQLRWYLQGNASSAGCSVAPTAEDTGVTGTAFTPRVRAASNSGVACGDQGFGLKVVY
jgi:adhesin/invasin